MMGCLDGKESTSNVGDLGLMPGSGKKPWRREWLPTPARVQPRWIQGIRSGDGVGELDTIALIKY